MRERVTIIGCGDVVRHRLLPALALRAPDGNLPLPSLRAVRLLSNDTEGPNAVATTGLELTWSPLADARDLARYLGLQDRVVVATPSFVHLPYARVALESGASVAVEKPLTCLTDELKPIQGLSERAAPNQLFSLNYYVLEKAMPLTYLCAGAQERRVLSPFLTFTRDDVGLTSLTTAPPLHSFLGGARRMRTWILEGMSRSPVGGRRLWTELPQYGGLLLETFIHAASVASLVAGSPARWQGLFEHRWFRPRVEECLARGIHVGPSWTRFSGHGSKVELDLQVGKYTPERDTRRGTEIEFEHGCVSVDFDDRSCTLDSRLGRAEFRISEGWHNYQIQMRLCGDVWDAKVRPVTAAETSRQFEVLAWLLAVMLPTAPTNNLTMDD